MLSITIPHVMETVLDEAINGVLSRNTLDCADLMAIALLDSTTRDLIGGWNDTVISYTSLVEFLKHRKADEFSEHPATVYQYNTREICLTGWAGFVIRFLSACDNTSFSLLVLISGLLEIHPPSIRSLLQHLGLDAHILNTRLSDSDFIMRPKYEGMDDVHFKDIWSRFFHWRMFSSNPDDIVDDISDPKRRVDLLIEWLDMEYEELDVTSPLRRGDVVVLVYDNVRHLWVLDCGGLWRNLDNQRVAGSVDIPRLASKRYRAPGSSSTMNRFC